VAFSQGENKEYDQSAITQQQGIDLIDEAEIEPDWHPQFATFFYHIEQKRVAFFDAHKATRLHIHRPTWLGKGWCIIDI
jgi:hypothetical protein